MVVPKNLSTKYKPIIRSLNRVDLVYYMLPCIFFIIIIDVVLFASDASKYTLAAIIVTIILFAISLIGLIKIGNARIYMYAFWFIQYVFQNKRKDSIYLKQLMNITTEDVKDNTIETKGKENKLYKEIYELSGDSLEFLFEAKQTNIINNFTNVFHYINNETVSLLSIPMMKDYKNELDFMVKSYKNSYDSKISEVVKCAKLKEIDYFKSVFGGLDDIRAKTFLVFHKKSDDNRKIINSLLSAGVNVEKVKSEMIINILQKIFVFDGFFGKNQFDYKNTSINFRVNSFVVTKRKDGKVAKNFGKFFAINNLPNDVDYTWLTDLFDRNDVAFTLKLKPVGISDARKQLNIGIVNARVDYDQAKNDYDKKRYELEYDLLNEQMDALVADNDQMFKISIIGLITADNAKDLNSISKTIFSQIKVKTYEIDALIGQQEKAYASFALKKQDYISNSTNIFIGTKALGYSYPFSNDNIQDSTGYFLGTNANGEPMIIDFSKYDDYKEDKNRISANGFVIGKTGSGKSFFTKKMVKNKLLCDNWEVNVIDPDGEYKRLAKNINGNYYDMSEFAINPFDIWVSLEEEGGYHNELKVTHINKVDGFFTNLLPHLTNTQKNILNDAVKELYKKFKINLQELSTTNLDKLQKQKMPLLEDLYDFLIGMTKKSNKDEIMEIAENLKPFIGDGMYAHLWNKQTNLKINDADDGHAKLNVFDVKSILNSENPNVLPTQFFLIVKFLQFRIFNNRKKQENRIAQGLDPNLYISVIADEFHKLRSSKLLKYLVELYKTIRKYFGDVWTISQDLSDWKDNNAKEIIDQSIFKFIFKLDQNAINDINKLIAVTGGLSKSEELQISNANQGEALVIYEERRFILWVMASEFEKLLLKKEGEILKPENFTVKFSDLEKSKTNGNNNNNVKEKNNEKNEIKENIEKINGIPETNIKDENVEKEQIKENNEKLKKKRKKAKIKKTKKS